MPIPATTGVHTRELLRDNVYSSLRDAIVDGTFAPGERLRDTDLESWLGVSRTPIREALLRLERSGLVVSQPGRTTFVSPLDSDAARNAREVAASMHELAARLSVPMLTAADFDELDVAHSAFDAATKAHDVNAALNADDRFHSVFVQASGNAMIPEVLELTAPLLRRMERLHFGSDAAHSSVTQHAAIIAAARAGDAERCATLCRDNWLALG